jgi:tRNA A-37 threonylcarbamoyl transferase component Bud32
MELDGDEALAAGTRFGGRYEILRLIGCGGMAAVYEAIHADLKKRVAIKTLLPSVAKNAEARARFLREGEAASRIRHPNVVDVTDVGTDGTVPFLVMEFLEGEDLGGLIEREAPLAVERTVDLLLPALAAVAAGHAAGVIHRDLKPPNIFLAKGYRGEITPKVLDFGVSKLMGSDNVALTRTAAVFGTPAYMSPEQALGAKQVDAQCDQYAFALVVYECLTGKRAHDGDNSYAVLRSIGDGRFDPPRRHRPDLPEALERILMRALALDPGHRFPSLSAFGVALLAFASPRAQALWADTLGAGEPATRAPTMVLPTAGSTQVLTPRAPATPARTPGAAARTPSAPARELAPPATTLASAASVRTEEELPPRGFPRRWLAVGGGALAAVGAGVWLLGRKPRAPEPAPRPAAPTPLPPPPVVAPPPPKELAVEVQAEPADATLVLDGETVGKGTWSARLPADGTAHTLRVSAPGFEPRTIQFTDQPPPRSIALVKVAAKPTHERRRPKPPQPRPPDDILLNRR